MASFIINTEQTKAVDKTNINGVFIQHEVGGNGSYCVVVQNTHLGHITFDEGLTLAAAKQRAAVLIGLIEA